MPLIKKEQNQHSFRAPPNKPQQASKKVLSKRHAATNNQYNCRSIRNVSHQTIYVQKHPRCEADMVCVSFIVLFAIQAFYGRHAKRTCKRTCICTSHTCSTISANFKRRNPGKRCAMSVGNPHLHMFYDENQCSLCSRSTSENRSFGIAGRETRAGRTFHSSGKRACFLFFFFCTFMVGWPACVFSFR